jgi:hypothetical protein
MCHLADAVALVDYYHPGELSERERAHDDALKEANRMSLREVSVGARVKLRPAYRKRELRGAVGTVEKAWGEPHYAAVQVRLDGGRSELLWHHEVEVIREEIGEGAFVPLGWGTAVPARERPLG